MNPFALALGLSRAGFSLSSLRLYDDLIVLADELLALSQAQGFQSFEAVALIHRGWSLAMKGRTEEGIAEIVKGREANLKLVGCDWPSFLLALAEALGRAGQAEEGLKRIDELEQSGTQQREIQNRLHRARAGLHLMLGKSDVAEKNLEEAIAVARGQQAKFLELLAGMDLAQLWSAQGKTSQARELLAPIYGWFTEGLDMPVMAEARILLAALDGPPMTP
jgi:tetratricopeptide (TPR) repeat protein